MATKKSGGSTKNGRDSNPKYLGVKCYGNQWIKSGSIIVKQRGLRFHPGLNVGQGKDHTLYALSDGFVKFYSRSFPKKIGKKFRNFIKII